MPKKKNKSDSYQYKIVEITVDSNTIGDFPLVEGLGSQMNLSKFSEEFNTLKKELMTELLKIIQNNLTERQCEITLKTLEGKTQMQIAREMGVHQTTVHKGLKGNLDYQNFTKENGVKRYKRYGGAIKKLQKICEKNSKIQEILKRMDEIKAEMPFGDEQWLFNHNIRNNDD